MADVNITQQKQAFLNTQIRLLSTPLTTPTPNTTTFPSSTLEPLIAKINKHIASHNRLVFGLQSQRHVAEQIDALYWQDVLRDGLPIIINNASTNVKDSSAGRVGASNNDSNSTVLVKRSTDLTSLHDLERNLGDEWDDMCVSVQRRPRKRRRRHEVDADVDADVETETETETDTQDLHIHTVGDRTEKVEEGDARRHQDAHENEDADVETEEEDPSKTRMRYDVLRDILLTQVQRRDELRRKVALYKKLQELLRPLENARENVQPNLVTRDNEEIEAELARMRVLLARAGNAIQAMPAEDVRVAKRGAVGQEDEMLGVTPDEKLESLLALG